MQSRWTRRALRSLDGIAEHIAHDQPDAAWRMVSRVRESAAMLDRFPSAGRPGRVSGTRELVIDSTPFIIAYRVRNDAVEILAVLHTSRRWPEGF